MSLDKTITCRECAEEFVFSVSEQRFFAAKGFTEHPSRCPECYARAAARNGECDVTAFNTR